MAQNKRQRGLFGWLQVVGLFALQKGLLDSVAPEDVPGRLTEAIEFLRRYHPSILQEIASTKSLDPTAEGTLEAVLTLPCKPIGASMLMG